MSDHKNKDSTSKDIRFTTKDDVLYTIILGWPEDGPSVIKSLKKDGDLKKRITSIKMLGTDEKIIWRQDSSELM